MQFPFAGSSAVNGTAGGEVWSLFVRKPLVAVPYVAVLGVAAVVGTLGNLVIITTVTAKQLVLSRRHRARTTTGNDIGQTFIVNLALSDLIVTSVINPLAISGLCPLYCALQTLKLKVKNELIKRHKTKRV